ncbi:MAG: phosphatidylglycerol lysyltransferase domain-containing protein [Chitinophagaceae bacterium]|nr:phosphatidylglycerol lysyltransferase domain-containing protein [Chitinophagaceae bacterium]
MQLRIANKFSFSSCKLYWREILALLMLLIAIFFFRSERKELHQIIPEIKHADGNWILAGLAVTVIYILSQACMYIMAFRALGIKYSIPHAAELFLKRNFLSVFLPAGGVSSLAYAPHHIRRQGIHSMQLHQASALYAFAGFLTVLIVGLPVIIIGVMNGNSVSNAWIGLVILLLLLGMVLWALYLLKNKRGVYPFIQKKFPVVAEQLDELLNASITFNKVLGIVFFSVLVEFCGIAHVGIAMKALHIQFHPEAAALAYIISVLLMIVSPFLRGLGAVEFSIALILGWYGVSKSDGLSATILYRVFEFWLPLAAGLFAFAWKGRELFVRIFPPALIFALGLINIISVVTPPLADRVMLLDEYIPYDPIHASNLMVFLMGLMLLTASAFLLKGLKSAWWFAIVLCSLSLIGHLTKALDWEEAAFAAITILFLFVSRKQYRIKHSGRLARTGITVASLVFIAVLLFGYTAFYFIDVKHFGVDFTWKQSLVHTLNIFLLLNDDALHPKTHFGHEFIWLVRSLGALAWAFLFYTIIRPFIKTKHLPEGRAKAIDLIEQYGSSSTDYFKTMKDKSFFFSEETDGVVSYRRAGKYAIVLEEAVCDEDDKVDVLKEFDIFCEKEGLIPAFYRVDENSISAFTQLRKRNLLIGQEAIMDLETFTLEGKDKKSLRNGLNSLQKKGYKAEICLPPHNHEFLQRLRAISDEWLLEFDKKEMIFSQGMFDSDAIKNQPVIVIRDEQLQVKAFLNIIPDYAPSECTYDLIRKTADAPGGCMDLLIISLAEYAKNKKLQYLNLGMAPMAGIEEPDNMAERIMQFAYKKFKRFQHYKGLRNFKEKYAGIWQNKYLVYENDFDLLQLPAALNKVMQP